MTDYPISPRVLAWLKNSKTIRILHRFDRSCNVLNQNDEMLSLVLPSIGLGPFSLIVPEKVLYTLAIEEGICVLNNGKRLEIGDWGLEIGEVVSTWNPVPQWSNLKNAKLSFDNVSPLPELIQKRFDFLLEQLQIEDEEKLIEVTQKLAGLGEGLTPIGDDLLMGMIFGLWVEQPDSPLISLIGETAVPLTTTLSGAFLKAAVDGEATIHWHNLANHKPNAKQKILSIGHTSGVAAWTGFVHTLAIERRKQSVEK